ncbi:MAG: serine hydrolase [Gemmatimonadota bacterium]|nr:serine hydrolase [Gemmatimonadota bacterium]
MRAARILLPAIAFGACTGGATSPSTSPAPVPAVTATLDDDARRWVDETLATLTLRQAVAQLVIPWIPGGYASESDPDFQELLGWVDQGLGGVSISIGVPDAYVAKLNRLQSRARIPLLVTSDFENGGPGMRINHSYAIPSLLAQGKHFPGHGDTRTDSHIELPVIAADRERLDRVELVPFRTAVAAGVDAVMTAHVAVPGVLGDDRPATMSPELMTDLLRGEMGFDGILFTDALRMGAITDGYGAGEAAVVALEAGSDVVLAPDGIGVTIDAVAAAVESGRITRERIDRSVRRLIEAKARLGLQHGAQVDPTAVATRVGTAEHRAMAERAAAASLTLVRDRDDVLPLAPGSSILSVTYARPDALLAGRTFDATLRPSAARMSTARVGPDTPWAVYDSLLHAARVVDAVVVAAYVPPRSGVGSVGVPAAFRAFVDRVRGLGGPRVAIVSFGSPYLLAAFPDAGTYMVAWGGWEVSQRAAARAVTGAAAVTGRLPISIPPLHRVGEGLDRGVVERVAGGEQAGEPRPDPLREAGFVPGEGEEEGGGAGTASGDHATGGPGRWRGGVAYPECAEPPDTDLADAFCRLDGAVISPREVDPARVGMSADSLAALDDLILSALADSAASGAALAVVRRGQLVRLRGYGRLDWDPDASPVTPSSIFDMASLTKVVGTTSAVVILLQRGLISLDDPVVDYLDWWDDGDPAKSRVTIRQLLVHRAGLPPFRRFFLEMEGRAAYEDAIGALPLDHSPGERTVYSDIGLMTAAFIVEAVTGMTLDDFLRAEVWRPLGMADTDFTPDRVLWDRVATTELDEGYRGLHVHGIAHDENAYAIGGVAGHAGLFSSARDLAVFAQMMLDRGVAGPCRADAVSGLPCHRPRFAPVSIFAQGWVDRITRRQSPESSRGLGWDTPSERSSAGDYFSARSFGHTGYTGTSLWVDPTQQLAVVLLTNRVNPTRDNSKHIPLRRGVHDRVARAIMDTPPALRVAPPEPGRP